MPHTANNQPSRTISGDKNIYGAGQDRRQTDRQTNRHINTMNRPGLRAGSIENLNINI